MRRTRRKRRRCSRRDSHVLCSGRLQVFRWPRCTRRSSTLDARRARPVWSGQTGPGKPPSCDCWQERNRQTLARQVTAARLAIFGKRLDSIPIARSWMRCGLPFRRRGRPRSGCMRSPRTSNGAKETSAVSSPSRAVSSIGSRPSMAIESSGASAASSMGSASRLRNGQSCAASSAEAGKCGSRWRRCWYDARTVSCSTSQQTTWTRGHAIGSPKS